MSAMAANNGPMNLGFLTVLQEASGFLGGYLVTNNWGRPLEFRLSSAVQPNKVQQILYGPTLQPYICADLIGKTLIDKAGVPVNIVITDREMILDLRHKVDMPVIWLAPPEDPRAASLSDSTLRGPEKGRGPILGHPRYPSDAEPVRDMLERLDGLFDLAEPFLRIREAIGEARKMGVTNR